MLLKCSIRACIFRFSNGRIGDRSDSVTLLKQIKRYASTQIDNDLKSGKLKKIDHGKSYLQMKEETNKIL
jgi:hypothetical protein